METNNIFVLLVIAILTSILGEFIGGQCPSFKPYNTDIGCVAKCPDAFYVNNSTCVPTCDIYVNPKNKTCQNSCPSDYMIREVARAVGKTIVIDRQCIRNCEKHEYIYNQSCVSSCPIELSYLYGMECFEKCPNERSLTRKNDILNKTLCLSNCQSYEYIYNGSCVYSCPTEFQLIDGQTCVEECPSERSLMRNDTWRNKTRCLTECSSNEYIYNNTCTYKCPKDNTLSFNRTCVNECPSTHPLVWPESECCQIRVCVDECPKEFVYLKNKICFKFCPDEKNFYFNKTCTHSCPNNFKYVDTFNGFNRCVDKCRPNFFSSKDTCVKQCSKGDLLYNKTCVPQCPDKAPYVCGEKDNYYCVFKTCLAKCPRSMFVHNLTCVYVCPESMVSYNKTCVSHCPVTAPYVCGVKDGYNCGFDTCLTKCPSSMFVHNRSCVYVCPESMVSYNKTCLNRCPQFASFIQDDSVRIAYERKHSTACVSNCRYDSMVLTNTTQGLLKCVFKCPPEFPFVWNRRCTSNVECMFSYKDLNSNIMCMDKCPSNLFALNISGRNSTCVKSCPQTHYYDYLSECVKTCPSTHPFSIQSIHVGWNRLQCVAHCPTGTLRDGKMCVDKCKSGLNVLNDKTCVEICPSFARFSIELGTFGNKYRACLNACPQKGRYYRNGECVYSSDCHVIYDGECLSQCPNGFLTFIGRSSGLCVRKYILIVCCVASLVLPIGIVLFTWRTTNEFCTIANVIFHMVNEKDFDINKYELNGPTLVEENGDTQLDHVATTDITIAVNEDETNDTQL